MVIPLQKIREDLERIIRAEEEEIAKINSSFLRNQAEEIRRMAEVER